MLLSLVCFQVDFASQDEESWSQLRIVTQVQAPLYVVTVTVEGCGASFVRASPYIWSNTRCYWAPVSWLSSRGSDVPSGKPVRQSLLECHSGHQVDQGCCSFYPNSDRLQTVGCDTVAGTVTGRKVLTSCHWGHRLQQVMSDKWRLKLVTAAAVSISLLAVVLVLTQPEQPSATCQCASSCPRPPSEQ